MRLTLPQKKVVLALAANGRSIRRAYSGARLQIYYWGAPTLITIDPRIFDALLLKKLIEQYDKKMGLWRLSKTGRRVAEAIQKSEKQ